MSLRAEVSKHYASVALNVLEGTQVEADPCCGPSCSRWLSAIPSEAEHADVDGTFVSACVRACKPAES